MTAQPGTQPLIAAVVAAAIRAQRYTYSDEAGLQDGIAAALTASGLPSRREVPLSSGDRVDVLAGGVAIEIKLAGSLTSVLGQLQRYAAHVAVTDLILVTTRARHRALPREIGGKPLTVIQVGGVA